MPGHQLLREQSSARTAAAVCRRPTAVFFRAALQGSLFQRRGCCGGYPLYGGALPSSGGRLLRLCRALPARQGALPRAARLVPTCCAVPLAALSWRGRSRRLPACDANHEGGGSGRAYCRPGQGGRGQPRSAGRGRRGPGGVRRRRLRSAGPAAGGRRPPSLSLPPTRTAPCRRPLRRCAMVRPGRGAPLPRLSRRFRPQGSSRRRRCSSPQLRSGPLGRFLSALKSGVFYESKAAEADAIGPAFQN